ncbi:MAG: adenosylcobinamide amidohydrolase [Desulfobacter sp.]|nr:MAG: adenosylcobinamide amidohydrolase [Desulfobacter sp.]
MNLGLNLLNRKIACRVMGVLLFCLMFLSRAHGLEIRDSLGNTIDLDAVPKRIVSLVPSASEILTRIGAEDLLVGTTYHDVTLKGSDRRKIVGGFFSPSLARIKSLNPDFLIVSPLHGSMIQAFKPSGIPVFVYETTTLDHAWELMACLGRITGKEAPAQALIQENQNLLAHVRAKLGKAGVSPKRVIRLMGRDKIMTPGKDSFQNEMIRAAGGLPPDFQKPGKVVTVTLEEWTAFDPQVIYGCGGDRAAAELFFSTPGWKDVAAVKNKQIYYLPCDLTCRASARTAAFVAGLSSMIYPQAFADAENFVHSTGKISESFLNKDPGLPGKMEPDLGLDYVDKAVIVRSHVFDFENKTLVIDLKDPTTVVSTLEGSRDNITTVANHYSPPPTWMPGHAKGIDATRTGILTAIDRNPDHTSLLMTGADMDHLAVRTQTFKEMQVTALVTAGVVSNAVRMAEDEGRYYEPGTINIILLTNMKLSPRAMTRAIISATEAKSALLQDLDIRSAYSGQVNGATGTGTDNVLVVQGQGLPIDNAGGHSKMGELIGRAVYAGVKQAIAGQNGILAGRHIVQRLEERKISLYQLTSGAQCNCQEKKGDFSAMVEHLLLNPEYSGFMAAALSLSDAYENGQVRDLTSFDQWCLGVAGKIAGTRVQTLDSLVVDKKIPLVIKKAFNAVMTGARIRSGQGE